MLKTIIRKLEKKKKKKPQSLKGFNILFIYLLIYFKLKRLTQNLKAELKRLWVGFYSRTK